MTDVALSSNAATCADGIGVDGALVGQGSVRDEHDVRSRTRGGDDLCIVRAVGEIGDERLDVRRAAHAQIAGDGQQLRFVARDEKQRRAGVARTAWPLPARSPRWRR